MCQDNFDAGCSEDGLEGQGDGVVGDGGGEEGVMLNDDFPVEPAVSSHNVVGRFWGLVRDLCPGRDVGAGCSNSSNGLFWWAGWLPGGGWVRVLSPGRWWWPLGLGLLLGLGCGP